MRGFDEFLFFFLGGLYDKEQHGFLRFLINKRKDLNWGSKKEGKSRNLVFKGCMNIIYEQYHKKEIKDREKRKGGGEKLRPMCLNT